MNIDFDKYRPAAIKMQSIKISRTGLYRYTVTRGRLEELIAKIQSSDISIEELKEVLASLRYIDDSERIADTLDKIKISRKSTVDKDLTYYFYMFYLDFYQRPDNDGILWSITQLGKRSYTYMNDSTKNIFEKNFQKLFGSKVNKNFDLFLKEEFSKVMGLKNFTFCEDFLIDFDSDILSLLLDDYIKNNRHIGTVAQNNIEKMRHKIETFKGKEEKQEEKLEESENLE